MTQKRIVICDKCGREDRIAAMSLPSGWVIAKVAEGKTEEVQREWCSSCWYAINQPFAQEAQ